MKRLYVWYGGRGSAERGREKSLPSSRAFTLVEMMIVVAVIGMLMAGMFKLVSAAGENTKKSQTIAKLQRLQNALSGFYAEYGTYPPVQQYSNPDPYKVRSSGEASSSWHDDPTGLVSSNANRAAGCQSTKFLFPNVRGLDEYVNVAFQGRYLSANTAEGGNDYSASKYYSWDNCKLFMFGMVSYLLPRVELMGGENLADGEDSNLTPNLNFFKKNSQWTKNNAGSLRSVYEREKKACSRWLPQLEKSLYGISKLLGEDVRDPEDRGGYEFEAPEGVGRYVLQRVCVKDGWGNDFYYYSAPPYQSYRIWSSGSDGNTFPPWISIESLRKSGKSSKGTKDVEWAQKWTEDDIVRFDR